MSETTTANPKQEKKPAKFDLSDGISSEDFIALGHGLLRFIVFILKIIFFPIIWVKRELVSLVKFLFSSYAERLLTDDEKHLVSSVPIFLGFLGLTLGAVFAILAYLTNGYQFVSRLQSVTDFFGLIGSWIYGFIQFIGSVWGFFYQDILIGLKNFIVDSVFGKGANKIITFLALSLVGFVGAILIMIVLEINFVRTFLEKVSDTINYIIHLPFKFYESLQQVWSRIISRLGYPVMGGEEMLDKYSNKFYQKALKLILLFAFLVIFFALYIFFTNSTLSQFKDVNSYIFFILAMLLAGLVAGYPVAYFIVQFLKWLSKDKYEARTVVPSAKATPTAVGAKTSGTGASTSASEKEIKPVPIQKLKGKTVKERAEERRRIREMEKKGK